MTPSITIRAIAPKDHEQWLELYTRYIFFCGRKTIDQLAIKVLWQWIMDKKIVCSVAVINNQLVGLMHAQELYSPLNGRLTGYLEDFFVEEDYRQQGIGEKLIDDLKKLGQEKGWLFVRWKTRDSNHNARTFYEKIAKKTAWQTYQLNLE